jgi:hypothetical protein
MNVFNNCSNLTSVTMSNAVTSLEDGVFAYCSALTSISLPDCITKIGEGAFAYCEQLTSFAFPAGVTTIGEGSFAGCRQLTAISLPNSVTGIEDGAFYECYALTSVILPESVTSMGNGVFAYCGQLNSVTNLSPTPQNIPSGVFEGVDLDNATLYVSAGSEYAYRAANVWQDFGTIEAYIPSVITMPTVAGHTFPAQVVVFDVSGKTMLRQTLNGSNDVQIAIGHLPKGVYLVRVNNKTIKIVTSDK